MTKNKYNIGDTIEFNHLHQLRIGKIIGIKTIQFLNKLNSNPDLTLISCNYFYSVCWGLSDETRYFSHNKTTVVESDIKNISEKDYDLNILNRIHLDNKGNNCGTIKDLDYYKNLDYLVEI